MKQRQSGVTLVELMLSILLMAILLVPIFLTFRNATATSLQGMAQVDLVLEGRRVLRQIYDDLRSACFELSPQSAVIDFYELVQMSAPGPYPQATYSFLRFPLNVPLSKAISEGSATGPAPRLANRVTYSVLPGPRGQQLIREERYHDALGGETRKTVLTQQLNYFRIAPVEIRSSKGPSQFFFQVTLQLLATRDKRPLPPPTENGPQSAKEAGVIIADFFDVVCPEFYAAFWNNEFLGRAWYTSIEGPP